MDAVVFQVPRLVLAIVVSLFFLISCGSDSNTSGGSTDREAPTQPLSLSSSNVTNTSITLSWDPSADNVAVTGYRLTRGGTEITTTANTSYTDTGLLAGTTYQYQVIAYDAAGNESAPSAILVQSTSTAADNEAPSIPTALAANSVTSNSIGLTWTASTDNTGVVGYRIFRDGTEISIRNTNSYSDSGLSANTQYTYTLTAFDAAGNESSQSTGLTVSTAPVISGSCGTQTGSVIALPFSFVTPRNVGKYVTLGATSTLVEYNRHSYLDAPDIDWSMRYKPYKYGDGGGAVTTWRLDTVPANGTLYEGTTALASNDIINDPDDLFYVPDNDFVGNDSFTYCAADATGLSNTAAISLQVADPTSYPMPIGITDPGFGIDESAPADPAAWPGAEATGYYYIDSDHPGCDDGNSHGYPDQPRCSIPSGASIAAGAKMVLASSSLPYRLRDSSWHQVNFNGIAGATSWLIGDERGPDKPVITVNANQADGTQFRITGGYLRISGVVFDVAMPRHMGGGADNVVLRHSEVKNNPSTGGGGTSINLSTDGENVLAFNVYAHDNGVVEEIGLSVERDIHAFVGSNQNGYWLLDNRCDENAGDCIQLGNNNTSSDVYVGRLVAHSEGENCIDIKDFNRVVVSESACWDLRPVTYGNSGGNAQNFYVNDEGIQQNYVYFLNNRSWDTGGANYAASNIDGRVYFIGNVSFSSPAGDGLNFGGGGGSRYVYFNTLSGSRRGMMLYGSGSSLDRFIAANVIDGASLYETRLQSSTSIINTLDYNFYTDAMGDFATGGSTPTVHTGLAAFQTATGLSTNSAEGIDAAFIDESHYDFRLQAGSVLIDSVPTAFMTGQPLATDLSNDLGIVLQDIAGTSRPQGSAYDAGAYSH